MRYRFTLADAGLAILIALPTLALPAPGNAATERVAEPTTVLAETHIERLAAAAAASGPQRVRS